MKYSSLPSHGEEEDNDNNVPEPPLLFVAPTCNERWVLLLSMMGFLMIVAALSLHDNKATQELRGSYFMNETELEVEPCSFWQTNCHHDDLSVDDLAVNEAFLDESSSDLTYDEVVEQFSEHIDEGIDEEEEQQQDELHDEPEDEIQEGANEMYGLDPMEVLYDPSRNDNPANSSEPNLESFSQDDLETPEEGTVSRIEDEDNFGN